MSWDVIYWDERKHVDYVPSCWSDGHNKYKYPKYCSRALLEQLIEKCDPLSNYKCKWYLAEVKKKDIKVLEDAKQICRKAEETSTLETEDSTSSEESGEWINDNDSDGQQDFAIKKPHTLYSGQKKTNFKSSVTSKKSSQCQGASSNSQCGGGSQTNTATVDNLSFTEKSSQNLNETAVTSLCNRSNVDDNQNNTVLTVGELHLSKKLSGIIFDLKELHKRFDLLEQKLLSAMPTQNCHIATSELLKLLPCRENEDLLKVNNMIQDEDHMNTLVECLYLCGGETYHKAIFLQMKK